MIGPQASRPNGRPSRFGWLVGAALAAIVWILSWRQVSDPDFWLHVAAGDRILETGRVPDVDPFSYTRAGAPWHDHSWGAEAVFALASRGGLPGLYLVRWALLSLAFIGIYLSCRRFLLPAAAGLLTLAAAAAAAGRFFLRPELFTYLGMAWLLFILEKEGRSRLWIPPLMLFWANVHGAFTIGLFILGAWTLGTGLEAWAGKQSWKDARTVLGWALAGGAACLINPHGIRAFFYSGNTGFLKNFIYSWQPFFAVDPGSWSFSQWAFPTAILLVAAAFLSKPRAARWPEVLLFAGLAVLGVRSTRNIFFLLIAAPIPVARALGGGPLARGPQTAVRAVFFGAVAAAAVWGYFLPRFVSDPYGSEFHRGPGFGLSPTAYPLRAAAFMRANLPGVRFFNTFSTGAYLAWRLGEPVFVDGRLDVYGPEFLLGYNRLLLEPERFPEVARSWNFRAALVDHANPSNYALLAWLNHSPDWLLAAYDANAAVFLERAFPGAGALAEAGKNDRPDPARLPAREAYAVGRLLLRLELPREALPFLTKAAEEHPDSPTAGSAVALAFALNDDTEKARRWCRRVLEEEPDDAKTRLLWAHLLWKQGHPDRAGIEASRALAEDPSLSRGWETLGDILLQEGRDGEALAAYERAAERKDLTGEGATRAGTILLQRGRFEAAAEYFRRVADGDSTYPEARIALAGCLARTDRRAEAMELYASCALQYPEYADACRYNLSRLLGEDGRREEARETAAEIRDPARREQALESVTGDRNRQ
ncbi:MAG TPA: tetratricopeptide repeat protein [bacterium]|nr:tetratricopeptide repeat protein [bacterium]HPQ66061.1 tetratricopeptide repeat protein [bacterium]